MKIYEVKTIFSRDKILQEYIREHEREKPENYATFIIDKYRLLLKPDNEWKNREGDVVLYANFIPRIDMRKRRRLLGYTQAEFARYLGVSQSAVSHWDIGHRHPSKTALMLMSLLPEKEYKLKVRGFAKKVQEEREREAERTILS